MGEDKPIKVDKWDGNAVKNALDDSAKKLFNERFEFKECFHLIDGRLLICTLSVGVACLGILWDYLHPFPKSRDVLILSVLLYFVLAAVLTLYVTFLEKNTFYVGLQKDVAGIDPDNKWRMLSTLKKYDDIYELEMIFVDGITNTQKSQKFKRTIAAFFDEEGELLEDKYHDEITKVKESLDKEKKRQ